MNIAFYGGKDSLVLWECTFMAGVCQGDVPAFCRWLGVGLEKEMAPHSSTLAWWAAVHGVVKSWTQLSDFIFTFMHWRRKWQPTPVFLPGEPQGRGAWWAAVYGVAQSQIRLKRLSSSSSIERNTHKIGKLWQVFMKLIQGLNEMMAVGN